MFSSSTSNRLVILILFLGLISFWQAQKDVSINSVTSEEFKCKDLAALDKRCRGVGAVVGTPPQVHNEMNDLSESYWSQYLCKKNDSSYIVQGNLLFELKEVRFSGASSDELTPADKLNSIEERGSLSAATLASRYYDCSDGKWAKWSNHSPYLEVGIEKINGQWQMEKLETVTPANCSKLPQ